MAVISFWHPAENHERFAPHTFDGAIGKQVPMKGPAREDRGLCTLVAAEVAEDGSGVMLTIEVPESSGPVFSPSAGTMGFSFWDPDPASCDPLAAASPRITWRHAPHQD